MHKTIRKRPDREQREFTPPLLQPPLPLLHPRPPHEQPQRQQLQSGPNPADHPGLSYGHPARFAPRHRSSPTTGRFSAGQMRMRLRGVMDGFHACYGHREVLRGHQYRRPCEGICDGRQRLIIAIISLWPQLA